MLRRLQESDPRQPLWLLRCEDQGAITGIVAMLAACLAIAMLRIHTTGDSLNYEDFPREGICFQTNINTADWMELSELPGVGPTLARRIVQHRQSHGPFRSLEELRQVRGVGPKTLYRLRPHLAPLQE